MVSKEDAKNWLKKTSKNIAHFVDDAVDEAKKAHESVQEQGGYKKLIKEGFDTLKYKANEAYGKLKESTTTNGEYDSVKVNALLKSGADLSKEYGKKAGKTLLELSGVAAEKAKTTWNTWIPSDDDLKRYEGIGGSYVGILFKPHYEKCLSFYDEANKVIPIYAEKRNILLEDIKHSASGNSEDLKDFYRENFIEDSRVNLVKSYLK